MNAIKLVLLVTLLGSASTILAGEAVPAAPNAGACPVTPGVRANDALQAFVPPDGIFVFKPGGAGFIDHDGALGIKFAWERRKAGRLIVGGRRLDGEAAPARAYLSDGYGDIGFQPIYLVFPTSGCWEITGSVADENLTFVVLVEKVGDGPSWHFEGVPRGWRLATH